MPFFAYFGLLDSRFARHLSGSTSSAAASPRPWFPSRRPGDAKNGISKQDTESWRERERM
jgi:hypothetical protein